MVSRIFKARYFPSTSFLEAELGNNPSYFWRSIWSSQELIRAGARVWIGNGLSIPISGSSWLQDEFDHYVTTDLDVSIAAAPVSSLLQVGTNCWDVDAVRDIFNERDCKLIMGLLIGRFPLG